MNSMPFLIKKSLRLTGHDTSVPDKDGNVWSFGPEWELSHKLALAHHVATFNVDAAVRNSGERAVHVAGTMSEKCRW